MRRLPWRRAPKAALSSPLTLIVAGVISLLSCFLAGAAVLHASAAGGATVSYQGELTCPDMQGPVITQRRVSLSDAAATIATVTRHASAHGLGRPQVAMYTFDLANVEFNGEEYKTRFGYTGNALEHLEVLKTSGGSGLSMGSRLAGQADVSLGTRGQYGALPPITAIHTDLSAATPRWWCSQRDMAVQQRIVDPAGGAVVFATDRASFDHVVQALGPLPLEWLNITFPDVRASTVAEASELIERSTAMVDAVRADLREQGLDHLLNAGVPFERSLEIAQQARGNVLASILPLAAISVLVGCAGVGTVVALQWYQRRHAQVRLLAARGTGPLALGGLAVAELGLPVLLGGSAGATLAMVLLPAYGPPGAVESGTVWIALVAAAAVLVVSLALLATVVGVRAHREFQVGRLRSGHRRWRLLVVFPWELVTACLAVAGWLRLRDYGGFATTSAPLPQVDSLALSYPVFVVLTVGILAARVAWLLLHVSHRARFWSRPLLQLAIRRSAGARAPVVGVLVIGVLAVGTLAAGTGIATGQEQALANKSGVFVGAESRVDTENPVGVGEQPLPAALKGDATLVGELTGTGSVVLVVEPADFASVAWLAGLPQARQALGRLTEPDGKGVPAVRVGHTPGQSLSLPGLPDAQPVADVPMFPIIGSQPGYVISRSALSPEQIGTVPRWMVLSSLPMEELTAALSEARIYQLNPMSRQTALDALPFYLVAWTFSYISLLGGVLGVIAALGLFVAVEVRRRQNALAGSLVLRMGLRPRALLGSHLIELGGLAGLSVLTGVVCGVAVAAVSVPRFDPVRWLSPRSELPDLTLFVVTVLVVSALVVAVAGWIAVRSVRSARTAELLRG
jgi:putative ABC transport system permease protein